MMVYGKGSVSYGRGSVAISDLAPWGLPADQLAQYRQAMRSEMVMRAISGAIVSDPEELVFRQLMPSDLGIKDWASLLESGKQWSKYLEVELPSRSVYAICALRIDPLDQKGVRAVGLYVWEVCRALVYLEGLYKPYERVDTPEGIIYRYQNPAYLSNYLILSPKMRFSLRCTYEAPCYLELLGQVAEPYGRNIAPRIDW